MGNTNATPSWSGYLHQGKVGILVSCLKVLELLKGEEDLKGWKIEFESSEDFDICFESKVESRHQVKAYSTSRTLNDYKKVLEFSESWGCSSNNHVSYCRNYGSSDNDIKCDHYVSSNSRYLHTIVRIDDFDLSKEDYTKKHTQRTFVENENFVRLFSYPDGNCYCNCEGDEDLILVFCQDIINQIRELSAKENVHDDIKYLKLLDLLDSKIRLAHVRQSIEFPTIYFQEILDIVNDDKVNRNSQIQKLRYHFINTWTTFMREEDRAINFGEKSYLTEVNLDRIIPILTELMNLTDDEFLSFFRDINPHESISEKFDSDTELFSLIKSDQLKQILFKLIVEVTQYNFSIDDRGFTEGGGYILSLIFHEEARKMIPVTDIMKNTHLNESFFEKKFLVNKFIDNYFVSNILNHISDTEEIESSWGDRAEIFDRIGNSSMKMISVDSAKRQLQGDEQ